MTDTVGLWPTEVEKWIPREEDRPMGQIHLGMDALVCNRSGVMVRPYGSFLSNSVVRPPLQESA